MVYKLQPNGKLKLDLGWKGSFRKIEVTGGPFNAFDTSDPDGFGIAVRYEGISPDQCDVHVPIRDFSVPSDDGLVRDAISAAFKAAFNGKNVYVGCMGGYGRTGLFLALMAKTAGIKNPVAYVRDTYHNRAVETDEQLDYVANFDVSEVRQDVLVDAWLSRIPGLG